MSETKTTVLALRRARARPPGFSSRNEVLMGQAPTYSKRGEYIAFFFWA